MNLFVDIQIADFSGLNTDDIGEVCPADFVGIPGVADVSGYELALDSDCLLAGDLAD